MSFPTNTVTVHVLAKLFGAPGHEITINPADYPAASLAHIWEYGWRQFCADAGAGAKNQDEAVAAIAKKLDKLRLGPPASGPRGAADGMSFFRLAAIHGMATALAAQGRIPDAALVTREKAVPRAAAALCNALGATDGADVAKVMTAVETRAKKAAEQARAATEGLDLEGL